MLAAATITLVLGMNYTPASSATLIEPGKDLTMGRCGSTQITGGFVV
jgi:hypothetical protein